MDTQSTSVLTRNGDFVRPFSTLAPAFTTWSLVVGAMVVLVAVINPSRAAGLGVFPIPYHAVAADAPILVSTGGTKPIRLGEEMACDLSGTIHVWDWSKSAESRVLKVKCQTGMAVFPDGKWIVTRDGQLIDVASGDVSKLDSFDGHVLNLRFSPGGQTLLLTVGKDKSETKGRELDYKNGAIARVLDFPSAKKRFEIDGQWPFTFACAFTLDSAQFFLMDKDKFVRRWDATTGKELGHYKPAFGNSIRAIAVSPDATRVVAAGPAGEIYLWETDGGKLLHKLVSNGPLSLTEVTNIDSLAFSPDGKLIAGGTIQRIVLWDAGSGKVVRELPNESSIAAHLRFSKDGKTLTSVHDFYGVGGFDSNIVAYPTVRKWEAETGKELKPMQ